MEEALRLLLMEITGLGVGWNLRPAGMSLPGISATLVSDSRAGHLDGSHGPDNARVQVDVWAATYAEARAATRAIKDQLHLWKGTRGGIRFLGVYVVGGDSGYEETPTGIPQRSRVDLLVQYTAAEE